MKCQCLIIVAALLCQGWFTAAQAQDFADNPVTIVLFPQAAVDDTLVSLQQMARVGGGPESLRKRIEKLDVADFPLDASHRTITGEQVRFRLLLAGIAATAFRLEGSKRTIVVESDETLSLRKVLGGAQQALKQRCGGDVALTPRRGVVMPMLDMGPADRLQMEARVKTPLPIAGKARVDVSLLVNGKTCEVVSVHFDVAEPEAVAPKKVAATRPAPPSAPPRQPEAKEYLIKSRDNVKIIANIGSARIEATGEAQQDGELGQIIRVRNVESNRIVPGRVEASGIVVVDY